MADYKEILDRFEALGFYRKPFAPERADFEELTTLERNYCCIAYYVRRGVWTFDTDGLDYEGVVSEANIVAFLEALERLIDEARQNGNSAHNN